MFATMATDEDLPSDNKPGGSGERGVAEKCGKQLGQTQGAEPRPGIPPGSNPLLFNALQCRIVK